MKYRLLESFARLFQGQEYRHRRSHLGDHVASFLIDDLYKLNRSQKLRAAVDGEASVLNQANRTVGRTHRRGDGTFGAAVPGVPTFKVADHIVRLGDVARIEIGVEVKTLAKAMIKQLDRVGTDMLNQVAEFKRQGGRPICIGLIGINRAPIYRGLEARTEWVTDGRRYKHPIQEAEQAEVRLVDRVAKHFDEIVVLRFIATNMPPLDFSWVDETRTIKEYGAALVRISDEYEQRF